MDKPKKSKATFTGESLTLLKQLSPKITLLAGATDSLEIRAEQLFKDEPGKYGKTAKQKLYLFAKVVNLGEGQPLFIEKNGQVGVRTNISKKTEIDTILEEAGIKNGKPLYERAKAYVLGKKNEGVAARTFVQKGKPEHADPFRGPRSFRGRYYGEGPGNNGEDFGEYEEGPGNENRPSRMSASERRAQEKRNAEWSAYSKKLAEEMERIRRSHAEEGPRVWAETHPGEKYPPEDPGWQWVPDAHEWQYFKTGYSNPFYNDEYWFGRRGEGASSGPSASARAAAGEGTGAGQGPGDRQGPEARQGPAASSARERTCEEILASHGISVEDTTTWRKWALDNHPDKGGDEEVFKIVSGCWTALTKGGGKKRTRKLKRKGKKTRRV